MDTCSIWSILRAHAALYILLAIAGIQHFTDASTTRRLRGPNICYHYDIGRYCCPGFEEVNGFCLLKRKADTKQVTTPRTSPFVRGSRIRFAPKPDTPRLVSLTKVDKDGRPLDVAYSHGRRETVQPDKGTVNSYKVETPVEQKGFYIPFDMEAIRRNLRLRASATTPTPATYPPIRHSRTRFSADSAPTRHGRIRFAPSPKPYRPWDDKEDRIRHHYNQVAVGKAKDGFFQAVLTDQVTDHQSPYEGQGQGDSTGSSVNREEGTEGTAQVRQREIVVYNETKDIPTTEKPEGRNDENRIYFQPEPIISEQQPPQWQGQQQGQDWQRPVMQGPNRGSEPSQEPETGDIIKFSSCPEGYTAVFSPEEGEFCYPTSALTPGAQAREDRAPLRGDGALRCPPGHDFRSSQFGDACVPYDWQPCSGEPGCGHSNEKLRVDPVFVTSDCQMSSGVATPCRNSGDCQMSSGVATPCRNSGEGNGADVPTQELQPSGGCTEMSGCGGPGCTDGGCDNSNDDIITFPPSDCGPQGCADCGLEGCSDCVDGSCGGVPNSGGCSGAECPDYPVSAGSGRCLNGGTSLNNGFCACQPGYYGSQCENDLDECLDRSPCSHECLNTIGSYKCFCPAGSILAPDGVSCILITCPKCLHGGYCDYETNKCVCSAGFTGEICETDIDECSVLGTCSQGCRNTFGSYACLCRQGYTLLRDGHTCEDYRCRPSCVNGGVCFKNRCLCPAGYSGIICQFNNRL